MAMPTMTPATAASAGRRLCHSSAASGTNSANTPYSIAPEAKLSTTASVAGLMVPTA